MEKQILKNAINRINKETPNLLHILQNKPYNSSQHKRAVEEVSFDLLQQEIENLIDYDICKSDSKKILKGIENRDAKKLISQIEELKLKLLKRLRALEKQNFASEQELFEFKPNFYGISLNLKVLWQKIKTKFKLFN